MSLATVYSAAQFGLVAETSASGLVVGTVSFDISTETATVPDHIGCTVGFSVYNPTKEISLDGVVATKGTGLVPNVGATVVLANTTANSRTRLTEGIGGTHSANAAIILTGGGTSGTATGFETGTLTGVYHPFVATNSPTVLT
jgi:hypothetical protein